MSTNKQLIDTILFAAYDVYVKRALSLKADKSTIYTKTESDSKYAPKTEFDEYKRHVQNNSEAIENMYTTDEVDTEINDLRQDVNSLNNKVTTLEQNQSKYAPKTEFDEYKRHVQDNSDAIENMYTMDEVDTEINDLRQEVANQYVKKGESSDSYDPTFKIIERQTFGTSGSLYIDLSPYMSQYSEIMIIIRSVVNAETSIGISNTTSGNSFLMSTAVTGTKYTKLVMNKTDEGNYAWTIGSSFGWSTSADYKYLKYYSASATSVSITAVIHGR